jgi:hypothetical protein
MNSLFRKAARLAEPGSRASAGRGALQEKVEAGGSANMVEVESLNRVSGGGGEDRTSLADEQVPCERRFWPDELRAEIRRRYAAGETMPALAENTGLPYATVKMWLSKAGREREARRAASVEGLAVA